ncbi:MAG: HNH endonuclease [Sulfurospirillum sp.]|nr:HNH endonuclease [Sulfurospirillum sp.]
MNLLFRLKQNEEGFNDIEETKDFFKNILPTRDNNYFYNVKKLKQVCADDTIYFAYAGYIVAEATFTGDRIENFERDKKYNFGHQLINIKIVQSSDKLDFKILSSRTTYLSTEEKIDAVKKALSLSLDIYPDEVESSLSEGTKTKVFVNRFERNPKARQSCLEHYGYNCQVCQFNFEKTYGKIGKDSIHVHHIIPISKIRKNYTINPIKDLLPVCPNCHLILHKKNAPTVEELKAQLDQLQGY